MANEGEVAVAERSAPKAGVVVTEIPGSSRQGFWATEFEWFKANPGVIRKYEDISPTTASYLRSTYGLDAVTRNTRGKRGDLYVQYDPATADTIVGLITGFCWSLSNRDSCLWQVRLVILP